MGNKQNKRAHDNRPNINIKIGKGSTVRDAIVAGTISYHLEEPERFSKLINQLQGEMQGLDSKLSETEKEEINLAINSIQRKAQNKESNSRNKEVLSYIQTVMSVVSGLADSGKALAVLSRLADFF